MRVRPIGLIRLRDEERGATLAIVGISLICLLGMLVLTFDLGRGEAIKRNMVNAADAAALAAARECGLGQGYDSSLRAAGQLVDENNEAADVAGFQLARADCVPAPPEGKNHVTVTARVPQEYFFAQIFGFDGGTVTADATAEWEAGVVNPVPLKVDQLKVKDCTTDGMGNPRPAGYAGPECAMPYEKLPGFSGSDRGILDFPEGWPIQGQDSNPKNCTSNAGGSRDLQNYIDQMGMTGANAFRAVLWNPPPTYACAEGGVNADGVQAILNWINATAGQNLVVFFPVVACDGQPTPGDPDSCYPWVSRSGRQAYPVVDFVGLRVVGAWKGRAARQHCTFQTRSADNFCVQMAVADENDPKFENGVVVRLIR
jgi:Flp pilus assembly protein TadG